MSIREQITQIAQSDPKFAQAVDAMERAVVNMPIMPEDLDEGIETLEKIVKDPRKYAQIRSKAIADDMVDEEMLPEQYDQVYIVSLLVALYGLQDRLSQKGYARGGLTVAARQLAAQGRGGDTELAHVNPREAAMLRRAGGSGTINPKTGLREYKSFLKKIKWGKVLAAVAPIALSVLLPGVGTAIGGFLSGGALAGIAGAEAALGGAAIGAASSAIGGENPLTGAITGGIGGGLGNVLGGAVNSGLGLGLSEGTANILGGGLAGAGASAIQGKDPIMGAVTGAVGAGISGMGGLGIENPDINRAVAGATRGFGNALTAGQSPSEALMAGGLGGLGAVAAPVVQAAVANSGLGSLASGLLQTEGTAQPSAATAAQPESAVAQPSTAAPNSIPTPAALAAADPGTTTSPLTQIAETAAAAPPTAAPGAVVPGTNIPETTVPEGSRVIAGYGGGLGPTTLTGLSGLGSLAENPNNMMTYGEGVGQATPPVPRDADGYPLSDTLPPNPPGEGSTLGSLAPLLAGGAALAALSSGSSSKTAPAMVQQAVRTLPASQQAYLNRPGIMWDWNKLSSDAASSNLTLDQFIARNWNRVTAGEYNAAPRAMAQGGLNAMARFVRGGGTGRSDEIDAKLSDGEYVIDAETVAMLGDGSSKAGAKRLDEMRAEIRKHKGKTLARGKFSPDAKSPLSYLKGVR
jgi:hypothetical protein